MIREITTKWVTIGFLCILWGCELEAVKKARKGSEVYQKVAAYETSPERLTELADSPSEYIRSAVATNRFTPVEILIKLSKDDSGMVLTKVAGNFKTPPEILEKLGNKDGLAYFLARNPNTPSLVLTKFTNQILKDKQKKQNNFHDPVVVEQLAGNRNTPPESLAKLINFSPSYDYHSPETGRPYKGNSSFAGLPRLTSIPDIQGVIASNFNTPIETLLTLAQSKYTKVRDAVASGHNTSPTILYKLSKDSDAGIRKKASENLNRPAQLTNEKYIKWLETSEGKQFLKEQNRAF